MHRPSGDESTKFALTPWRRSIGRFAVISAVVVATIGVHVGLWAQKPPPAPQSPGVAAFEKIAEVLNHRRCTNCHQREFPLVGDSGRAHVPRVARAAGGRGTRTPACASCHRAANNVASGLPGAPNWQLAPVALAWAGKSTAQLCRDLKNPAVNGNRPLRTLVSFMTHDPLALWAWSPGLNRSAIVMPHSDFVGLLNLWVESGAPCPG